MGQIWGKIAVWELRSSEKKAGELLRSKLLVVDT